MATATPPLHLWAVLSESKRIINAHSRHFLALSVIFLLPISFSFVVYPTLLHLLFSLYPYHHYHSFTNTSPYPYPYPYPSHSYILFRSHSKHQPFTFNPNPNTATPLFFSLFYSLFLFVFSLCALATITYSVFHGFYGRPVKLLSAIKSIFSSFFPLLATIVVSQAIVFFISLLFALVLFLLIRGIELVGITISYSSPYFLAFSAVVLLALLFVLVYLQVTWTLVPVIVVVESSWGLEPLRRSASLIRGMKWVGLSSLLFFGFFAGILVWSGSVLTMGSQGTTGDAWKDWAFVVQIVVTSTSLMLLLLYNTAANTVLYMYCKAINGELALEIAAEFAREYVSLPFDDGKVPHVVSVVHV